MRSAGHKADHEKPPMALLSGRWLTQVSSVLGYGARKYAPDNWRKGITQRRLLGAAMRHLCKFMDGEDLDVGPGGSGLNHLDHLACCVMFARVLLEDRPDLDDRLTWKKKNAKKRRRKVKTKPRKRARRKA